MHRNMANGRGTEGLPRNDPQRRQREGPALLKPAEGRRTGVDRAADAFSRWTKDGRSPEFCRGRCEPWNGSGARRRRGRRFSTARRKSRPLLCVKVRRRREPVVAVAGRESAGDRGSATQAVGNLCLEGGLAGTETVGDTAAYHKAASSAPNSASPGLLSGASNRFLDRKSARRTFYRAKNILG